jgi:glucosamine--fructose-6-phosphate aminotransferase (isomerizing)
MARAAAEDQQMRGAGEHTLEEIHSQPEAWEAALGVIRTRRNELAALRQRGFEEVVFTGCGSTYYMALAAAALFQGMTGLTARGLPASEIWLGRSSCISSRKTLLVALSRSGETTETLAACTAFLESGRGELVTLSCYPEAPLASMGQFNLVLESGMEQSIAQTRAFSTLYLATVSLTALWAERDRLFSALGGLADCAARLIGKYRPLAGQLGGETTLERFYWLGGGPRHGLACELSLKMKEMSLTHSEPFHFMEFRHGPKAMVSSGTLVIGLRSSSHAVAEDAVLKEVQALGGRSLTLAESDADVEFVSGLEEAITAVLYLPVGQLVAYERAIHKGLDPDRPHNLDAVVKLA